MQHSLFMDISRFHRDSKISLWFIACALCLCPLLLFVRQNVWIGPLALLICILLLWFTLNYAPLVPRSLHPFSRKNRRVSHFLFIAGIYVLTLTGFYLHLDTWERWTWLMHSTGPGQVLIAPGAKEAEPSLDEILHRTDIGRWHGPHITHGVLHSKPLIWALRLIVDKKTSRFSVNQLMRFINALCALCGIPLLFFGLREWQMLEHIDVPILFALLSPGVFMVTTKGHWLGISYGFACCVLWCMMNYLRHGTWWYLLGFAGTWGILQGMYTGALYFVIIFGGILAGYVLIIFRKGNYYRRTVWMGICAFLVLFVLVGNCSFRGIHRHLQGNGESLFEIQQNLHEQERFATYLTHIEQQYGIHQFASWPLFYRAGLGMIANNISNFFGNLFGTGTFHPLWLVPDKGQTKSFGFVLPWFIIIGGLVFWKQQPSSRVLRTLLLFAGSASLLFGLLLLTWAMSAHRIFGINLLLAAVAGVIYDKSFYRCKVIAQVDMQQVIMCALIFQALIFLGLERCQLFGRLF